MTYLTNTWYVAAWSDEVGTEFFTRTLLDIPVLFFRQDNRIVALQDMCPHRFAPLSRGTIVDGRVRCGYHGLEFDTEGNCVGSCLGQPAPRAARVRAFPTFEQDHAIWIWMGNPALADPGIIPRFPHHDDTSKMCNFGLTTAEADYRLLSDNLMDLTHTAMLHPDFGGLDYAPKFKCWAEGNEIISSYVIEDMPSFIEPGSGKTVRHEDEIRWYAPGMHILNSTTRVDDSGDEASTIFIPSGHLLTPETRTSTHYFWSSAYDASMPFTKDEMRGALIQAFDHEDKPMVEAVQRRMAGREIWEMNPILLPSDAGGVRMRRKLDELIAAEQDSLVTGRTDRVNA